MFLMRPIRLKLCYDVMWGLHVLIVVNKTNRTSPEYLVAHDNKGQNSERNRKLKRNRSLTTFSHLYRQNRQYTLCTTVCTVSVAGLTIVGHVSVSFLEDEVDSMSSSPDLLHSLTVSHPWRTVSVYLHQLVWHLREQVRCYSPEIQTQKYEY